MLVAPVADSVAALAVPAAREPGYAYSHRTGAPRRRMLIPNTVATDNAGDAHSRALRFLPEQLDAAQIQGRGRLLDTLLSGLLGHGRRLAPEVLWAWHELHRTRGLISAGQSTVGALSSARHLERQFREQVGRTPGEIARILRCRNALRLQARGLPLHSVAELAGFHDQAHFHHVVKATTGLTPTQLPLHDSLEWSAEPDPGSHS
ncbi:helix-turn-helix transcriptional regulator [Streptomyces vinaceus]|uniref:helix-turn-helix transcriptional regulator n=1 Tax=Streptomyces vinaceus TaxID=1960 RepID=UPI0035E30399